ncbi:hypothetical protein K7N18_04995 [Burkholderia arboris]|uniref:hypothetical protein n=1 Tax=Burkholderia arboris TaxID=488730 RepID=UPI001CA3C042|nr:hypothetical protein [Burkholderia arboris]MBY8604183.1 hypothetical protein [Burkholderia arboris]
MTTTTDKSRADALTDALRRARAELEIVEWENDPPRRVVDLFSTIDALLVAQQPEPRDAIERSKRILGLVDSYHDNPTQHTRTALRAALMDEFHREPRAEVTALIEAAEHVVSADRACALVDSEINALAAAIDAARSHGWMWVVESRTGRCLETTPPRNSPRR